MDILSSMHLQFNNLKLSSDCFGGNKFRPSTTTCTSWSILSNWNTRSDNNKIIFYKLYKIKMVKLQSKLLKDITNFGVISYNFLHKKKNEEFLVVTCVVNLLFNFMTKKILDHLTRFLNKFIVQTFLEPIDLTVLNEFSYLKFPHVWIPLTHWALVHFKMWSDTITLDYWLGSLLF